MDCRPLGGFAPLLGIQWRKGIYFLRKKRLGDLDPVSDRIETAGNK